MSFILPQARGALAKTCSPESPRWLAYRGHHEAAQLAVALVSSNGNIEDPVSNILYEQIVKGIELERSQKLNVTIWGIIKDPVARRRLLIGSSTGIFASTAGNVIATFYLGAELKTAGITNIKSQLKAVNKLAIEAKYPSTRTDVLSFRTLS